MSRKVLVDEETVVWLLAQAALSDYMIELLTSCVLRSFHSDDRDQWLDELEAALTRLPLVQTSQNDEQAVLLSDAAVMVGQHGRSLMDRLRKRASSSSQPAQERI